MKTRHPKRFCFTWALPGGAWIEYDDGERQWVGATSLDSAYGHGWFERQCKRHGWMTGCWIEVE